MKPHKGYLANCKQINITDKHTQKALNEMYGHNLGYYLSCNFVDHPFLRDDPGTYGHTSLIVKQDDNEVETLNSRYTIISFR